jgi:hypothetical protein
VQDSKPAPAPGDFPERKKSNDKNGLAALGGGFTGVVMINVVIWFVIGLANGGHWPHFWPVWLLIPWTLFALSNLGKRR